MKLSMSTNAFKKYSLEDAIEIIAEVGYAGIEILGDTPHILPMAAEPERYAQIGRQIAAAGLTPANVNAFTLFALGDTYHPSWIEPDAADRRVRQEHTEASLHFAAAIGCPNISTEPGGPTDRLDPDAALDRFEQGVRAVLPTARQTGTRLLIEPEPDLLIERWEQIEEFLARFDDEPVGLNFDAGHFFCVGQDPAALIRSHGAFIEHVHIEDIAANRVHQHLVPGDGAMDFAAIFDALREIDYDGFVTLELYPYQETAEEVARRGFDHLSRYL